MKGLFTCRFLVTYYMGLNWNLLCGGGLCGIELIYMYIYIFTFSNLADTFIQSDLQTRTIEIYMYYVCVLLLF